MKWTQIIHRGRFLQTVGFVFVLFTVAWIAGQFRIELWPIALIVLFAGIPYYINLGKGLYMAYLSSGITFFAIIFKLQHWPGSGPAAILAVLFFGFIYSPLFYLRRQPDAPLWLKVLGVLTLPVVSLGWVFKVQHFYGAALVLKLSLVMSAVFLLVLFILGNHRKLRFTRSDIAVHVIFFSLASIILVTLTVRIKVAPLYTSMYTESIHELHEAKEQIHLLNKIYESEWDSMTTVSGGVSAISLIRDFSDQYKQALSEHLNCRPDQLDSLLLEDWARAPVGINEFTDNYFFTEPYSSGTTYWRHDEFSDQLATAIRALKDDPLMKPIIDSSKLLDPEATIVLPFRQDSLSWHATWFWNSNPLEFFTLMNLMETEHYLMQEAWVLRQKGIEAPRPIEHDLITMEAMWIQRIFTANRANDRLYGPFMTVLILLLVVFVIYLALAPLIKSDRVFHATTFMLFVLFFEYLLFLTMPYWENKFGNNIFPLFAMNALMALLIVPVHNYFEDVLRKRVVQEKD